MPVHYTPPTPESMLPVPGIALGPAAGRIKNWDRNDVLLVVCEPGTVAAGVFTQNRFCAAPVIVCRRHLAASGQLRALVVNAGNANAGTGDRGVADAETTSAAVAPVTAAGEPDVIGRGPTVGSGRTRRMAAIGRRISLTPTTSPQTVREAWWMTTQGMATPARGPSA